jgi:hypothetical protein
MHMHTLVVSENRALMKGIERMAVDRTLALGQDAEFHLSFLSEKNSLSSWQLEGHVLAPDRFLKERKSNDYAVSFNGLAVCGVCVCVRRAWGGAEAPKRREDIYRCVHTERQTGCQGERAGKRE